MPKLLRTVLLIGLLSIVATADRTALADDSPATQPADSADSFAAGDTDAPYTPIAKFWEPQTAAQQADAVAKLKDYVDRAMKTLHHHPLTLHETKYFLFYSDLTPSEADKWAGMLDAMYARLATIFGIKPGENIWRGKALILVFFNPQDYREFEIKIEKSPPGPEQIATFHYFSNGRAYIVSYRAADQMKFAHLLVNQATVGFLFRYRSPVWVPTWAGFGLAEAVASQIVQNRDRPAARTFARQELSANDDRLGDFFTAQSLPGWQNPVAQALCEFMLKESKPNYVAFINGIKAGLSADESLEKKYHCPKDRLLAAFAQYLSLPDFKR